MLLSLVGAYFLILPLLTFPGISDPFEYPKVSFFLVTICFLFLAFLPQYFASSKLRLTLIDFLLLFLLVSSIISWSVNGFSLSTLFGQFYRYQGIATLIGYYCLYFILSRHPKPPEFSQFIILGSAIFSLIILTDFLRFNFLHHPVYTFNGRMAGPLGNPNFAAGFLALSLPFLLTTTRLRPFLKIIFFILLSFAIFTTQSRSGILAFFLIFLTFLVQRFRPLLFITPIIIITIIYSLFSLIPRYSSFENQFVVWSKSLTAISLKPVFGWGMDNFNSAFQSTLTPNQDFDLYHVRVDKAHNEILEIAVSGGLVSLTLYLALLIIVALKIIHHPDKPVRHTLILLYIAFLTVSSLNVINITEYLYFYYLLAIVRRHHNTASSFKTIKSPHHL